MRRSHLNSALGLRTIMFDRLQKRETYRVLGLAAMHSGGSEYKISWAMHLLEQGIETSSLAILASLLSPVNEFEAEDYFNIVLSELGIERSDDESVLKGYAKALAQDVLEGVLSPEVAVSQINEINILLGYPDELAEYISLDDEWYCECINGWSEEQRRHEIIEACKDVDSKFTYPEMFKA